MWKPYEIQVLGSINKVLLEHSHTHSITSWLWLFFTLQQPSPVTVTETWWPTKQDVHYLAFNRKSWPIPALRVMKSDKGRILEQIGMTVKHTGACFEMSVGMDFPAQSKIKEITNYLLFICMQYTYK